MFEMENSSFSSFVFHLDNELRFTSNRHCLEKWPPEPRGLYLGDDRKLFAPPLSAECGGRRNGSAGRGDFGAWGMNASPRTLSFLALTAPLIGVHVQAPGSRVFK
jgi:hypothetical protein